MRRRLTQESIEAALTLLSRAADLCHIDQMSEMEMECRTVIESIRAQMPAKRKHHQREEVQNAWKACMDRHGRFPTESELGAALGLTTARAGYYRARHFGLPLTVEGRTV